MAKVGPNDPCPCGSGKKYKKCCRGADTDVQYTVADRRTAHAKLDAFVDDEWAEIEEIAYEQTWGRFLERADELPPPMIQMSNDVHDTWFAFDYEVEHGVCVVDDFLEVRRDLTAGERAFLRAMRGSTMRVYEVVDVVPGVSLTLTDLLEGGLITVHERSGSRTIPRHALLAARVVPRGASGQPEMEAGILHLPDFLRGPLVDQLKQMRAEFLHERPSGLLGFYKALPPILHEAWAACIFEPSVPELHNTDGDLMVETHVVFDVLDSTPIDTALASCVELERSGEGWSFRGSNSQGVLTSFGTIQLRGDRLELECNSVERGERGRSLLERLLPAALRHRATTHEDVRRKVQERLTAVALGKEEPTAREPDEPAEIPFEVADELCAQHYGSHYRAWIDEPVPALDGKTPRAAAREGAMRSRVLDLIHQIEGSYQRALREGQPAYDPSWMYAELGLEEASDASHPPPLAHERVASLVPGAGELAAAIADRVRRMESFEVASTILDQGTFDADLEVQRFLRGGRPSANESGAEPSAAAPHLRAMINFELHRRKSFWVDGALAYMLGHTDLDVVGRELRAPFASFALVFTDRHVLSLLERLISRDRTSSLAGHFLRVVTVYVTEERSGDERTLDLRVACDALGADLPHVMVYRIALEDEGQVARYLDEVAPRAVVEPPVPDAHPLRGLLRVIVNAILYTTSADVEQVPRTTPKRPQAVSGPRPVPAFSSEEVYYLPGAIEITNVRRMQELERAPSGRTILRRYMVRGHFRRAAKNWTDQKLRWVQPYWKGPDMAAIIERTYRLK